MNLHYSILHVTTAYHYQCQRTPCVASNIIISRLCTKKVLPTCRTSISAQHIPTWSPSSRSSSRGHRDHRDSLAIYTLHALPCFMCVLLLVCCSYLATIICVCCEWVDHSTRPELFQYIFRFSIILWLLAATIERVMSWYLVVHLSSYIRP